MTYAVCHPESLAPLWEAIVSDFAADTEPDLASYPIRTSAACPRFHWSFPVDRFVEYEEGDEDWCRFFGIGAEDPTRPWWALVTVPVVGLLPHWEPPPPPPLTIHFLGPAPFGLGFTPHPGLNLP